MPEKTGCRIEDAGLGIEKSGLRIQDSGFRIQDSGFRVQDSGLRIQDSGLVESTTRQLGDSETESPALNPDSAPHHPQSSILTPVSGTLLAFDFGTQRIGVAVGNTFSSSAQPLTTIDEEKNELRFAALATLIREWQPCALLVGLPGNDDGTPHQMTALCRRFAKRLHGRFGLPTLWVDERYTSLAASEQLNKQGIRGRQQKSLIDQYAAQQIMQAYFDEPAACEIVGADRDKNEKSAT